ncbi:AraC family transcriptional regulator [Flavobacterium sp.]|uniref:helix-turn-helix domain-containing protein n=1 Tax=Flavobacterium sp. TaxID=239 RepID=UPI002487122F|nr:AraC family transcriptional regulator [Flavobacterium sp.]MDI1317028.1 AraC family transcriptional regulator [Flavobacterium sp.]
MKLFVKNMVCNRCILVVKSELEQLGFELLDVKLGEVQFSKPLDDVEKKLISNHLEKFGFELLGDKNSQLIEKIKAILIDLTQNTEKTIDCKLSDHLVRNLNKDYSKLSNLFSEIEGISIEKYFINLRIEKVKELIFYDELSLSEIAIVLNFSNVAHLSNQFKKVTGFSPSYFKTMKNNKRIQLDKL